METALRAGGCRVTVAVDGGGWNGMRTPVTASGRTEVIPGKYIALHCGEVRLMGALEWDSVGQEGPKCPFLNPSWSERRP